MSKQDKNEQEIRETVRTGYRAIAIGQASPCCCSDRSGPADPARLAAAIGYDEEDLANLPDGANMGLSCGNPVAIAALQDGQTVLDLGAAADSTSFRRVKK